MSEEDGPPDDYRGLRVGDETKVHGKRFRVTEIVEDREHLCGTGRACRERWKLLMVQVKHK